MNEDVLQGALRSLKSSSISKKDASLSSSEPPLKPDTIEKQLSNSLALRRASMNTSEEKGIDSTSDEDWGSDDDKGVNR
jgi:hypothetical protein